MMMYPWCLPNAVFERIQPRSPHEAQRNAGKKPITATWLPAFHFVSCGLLAQGERKFLLSEQQNRGKP